MLRLSDETETLIGLAQPDAIGAAAGDPGTAPPAGCVAITGYEGTEEDTAHRREGAAAVLRACGGEYLGPEPGDRWAHGRYSAPICATPCSTRAPSPKPWRPPPSGPGSPHCTSPYAPR